MVGTKILGMTSPDELDLIKRDWDEGFKEWTRRWQHGIADDDTDNP